MISPKSKAKKQKTKNAAGKGLVTPSGVRVPPAWKDVWVTTDPESHIQATGRDSKGRRVYLYSAEYMGRTAVEKFTRLKEFARAYPFLIKKLRHDRRESEAALLLYLIAKTGFRIGSDIVTLAEARAYGASTLYCYHVSVEEDKVAFHFIGKKGIKVNKILKDKFLAREIAGRCNKTADHKIFSASDRKIRAYLSSISGQSGFTIKDFRTYLGTRIAFRKIKTLPVPQNLREFRKYRKEVAEAVAGELGNTPGVALKSYISPEVFCVWESGHDISLKEVWGKSSSLLTELFECVYYDESIFNQK